jgi:hypothetical protein
MDRMSDDDADEKLPALRPADAGPAVSAAPAVPPLATPSSTGLFSRWRVDQDTLMLQSLYERQKTATALLAEYGRTAEVARRTDEQVALLTDLDAIRAEARARGADERAEAAHQRQIAALRRQQELAQQQHKTNVAEFGEKVFRETAPEREKIRKEALKKHEHEMASAISDAEARALSAAASRNNAAAVSIMSDRDLAELSTPVAAASAPVTPAFSNETVFQTIDAEVRSARTCGNQAGIDALNNLAARLMSNDSYAPGTTLNLAQVLALIADEIDKATARNLYAAAAALYRLRDALSAAADSPS